uniref:DUF2442 domain-containing protein n=1 Tax=Candidatus Kentrum sp. TC TaxID=2126339 RepID=A0A450YAC7_9GAMM|nr:MAG: Protein of unknown function (DUF2442) [Candidatus Kentron sp. TC]VFK54179.1 MAG: Protein of unknown function (DUF2442) [Candidatus Kentron sp. TC]
MIQEGKIITMEKAEHIGSYKLGLRFNDHTRQIVDFYPFLSSSCNPLITKYLNMDQFLKFEIEEGDLEWNDYDLCFPIADLYENKITS